MWKKCICAKSLHSQLGSGKERVNQHKNIYSTNRGSEAFVNANICKEILPNFERKKMK